MRAADYFESIHGQALVVQGLLVAPSCADCHGKAHRDLPGERPTLDGQSIQHCGYLRALPLGAAPQVPRGDPRPGAEGGGGQEGRHARCFGTGRGQPDARQGRASGGPQRGQQGQGAADVQHLPHGASIVMPGPGFQLASDKICGSCHEDRLKRYRDTYHGQAHDSGLRRRSVVPRLPRATRHLAVDQPGVHAFVEEQAQHLPQVPRRRAGELRRVHGARGPGRWRALPQGALDVHRHDGAVAAARSASSVCTPSSGSSVR